MPLIQMIESQFYFFLDFPIVLTIILLGNKPHEIPPSNPKTYERVTFFHCNKHAWILSPCPGLSGLGFMLFLSLLTDTSTLGVTVIWNKSVNQKGSHVCIIINVLSCKAKGLVLIIALPSDSQSYLAATLFFYAATFLPLAVFLC